jgi:hypothetical protein
MTSPSATPQLLRVDRLPTSEHRNELLDSALPGVGALCRRDPIQDRVPVWQR